MKHPSLDLDEETVAEAAATLAAAGDALRFHLLVELARGPRTVSELAARVARAPTAVSKALGVLRRGGLVQARRRGQYVHYSWSATHVGAIVSAAVALTR